MKRCWISLIIKKTHINTTLRYHFTPIRMAIIKPIQIGNKYWRGCRETGTLVYCWCECKMVQMQKIYEDSSKKLNSSWTSRYIPKRIENRDSNSYLYVWVHSSIIYSSQKMEKPKYPSRDEQINRMWYIHVMDFYSVLKENEILKHVTTWINLKTLLSVK